MPDRAGGGWYPADHGPSAPDLYAAWLHQHGYEDSPERRAEFTGDELETLEEDGMDDELAEMKRQYPYATAETHMLIDGVVHLRCHRCRVRPVPKDFSFVELCDECLAQRLNRP